MNSHRYLLDRRALFLRHSSRKDGDVLQQNFSEYTLLSMEAALLAGNLLKKGFGTSFSISSKEGKHNLVTEYDHKAEKIIIEFLQSKMPGARFLAEESGSSGSLDDALLWIVDPLDGTVNFAHKIPVFSVSIALEKAGELFCGVVYQPLSDELFVAERGKGAFLNGNPITVSPVENLENSILSTGFPYNIAQNPFHCIDHFIDIVKQGIPIRRLGSAALDLAYTAAGRFEGFFEVGLSPWDCAAGILLVEEAGGAISHWDLKSFLLHEKKTILATNNKIHKELSHILCRTKA